MPETIKARGRLYFGRKGNNSYCRFSGLTEDDSQEVTAFADEDAVRAWFVGEETDECKVILVRRSNGWKLEGPHILHAFKDIEAVATGTCSEPDPVTGLPEWIEIAFTAASGVRQIVRLWSSVMHKAGVAEIGEGCVVRGTFSKNSKGWWEVSDLSVPGLACAFPEDEDISGVLASDWNRAARTAPKIVFRSPHTSLSVIKEVPSALANFAGWTRMERGTEITCKLMWREGGAIARKHERWTVSELCAPVRNTVFSRLKNAPESDIFEVSGLILEPEREESILVHFSDSKIGGDMILSGSFQKWPLKALSAAVRAELVPGRRVVMDIALRAPQAYAGRLHRIEL